MSMVNEIIEENRRKEVLEILIEGGKLAEKWFQYDPTYGNGFNDGVRFVIDKLYPGFILRKDNEE